MSRHKYKYSFLVPTHQRGALLKNTLRGLLLQEHDDYQVVVSNNYSQDETRLVLAEFANHPRVRIVHTDRKMSMPVHWEFAMDYVEGEHVIILGDDDGVRTDFLSALDKVIDDTGANIVKFKTGLYYHADWVDEHRNTLEFDDRCSNRYFEADKFRVIQEFCDFSNYALFPNLLQTSFSLDLFRKVKARSGVMFVGAPDWSCPFMLLMDDSAKLAYIDSTLGYGGRSQMSNAAYYQPGKDEARNERITDFVNELTAEFRFPHHAPLITTAGNFTPAAFSFAKHYYPDALRDYALDAFELAKVIQADIGEEAVSGRQRFWSDGELEVFRGYVEALPAAQRNAVLRMAGYFSLHGRIRLFLKHLKRRGMPLIPAALKPRRGSSPVDSNAKYPWPVQMDVGRLGITDGCELMRRFAELVAPSDALDKTRRDPVVNTPVLSPRGQLHLPMPSPSAISRTGAGGAR